VHGCEGVSAGARGRGPLLVVLAKRPEPGRVKTRLCPPFTPEQAAGFYAAMLRDVLETMAAEAPGLGLALRLAVHPAEAVADPGVPLPPVFEVVAQQGADLSERMDDAARRAHAEGFAPVLLRGSDSPLLDGASLGRALDLLAHRDVVLGPDLDGGYNLVGLRRPLPGLFAHEMSTGRVLEDTCKRARELGASVELLPGGFDIDTFEDLRILWTRSDGDRARLHSCAYLDRHGLWPERIGPNSPR